jgi:hypothetical protein
MRTGALLRVHFESKVQEVFESGRQIVLLLDRRRAICRDQIERAQGRLGQVWRLALNHLDRHDTQTPDVDFAAVFFACDNLGSHPVWCADHGRTLHVRLVNLGAETEIGQLDVAIHAEQNVVRLDVSVDNTLGVQELQAVKRLAADSGDLALRHHVEGNNIGKTTTLHVLHHHPKIATNEKRVHEVDDILMSAISHDQNFINDEILLRLLFQVHLLDGDALVGANLEGRVNTARSTLTDLDEVAELLRWIGRIADDVQFANDLGVGD